MTLRRSTVIDAALAGAVTALMALDVFLGEEVDETFADRPVSAAILLPASAALLWRRRAPLAVAAGVAAALVAQAAITGTFAQGRGTLLLTLVAAYSLGAHTRAAGALAGTALLGAALHAKALIAPPVEADDSPFVALFFWLLLAALAGFGALVRTRRGARGLRDRAAALDAERTAHARAAVEEERARIARDLHDVVSHNVSASVLQAEAARQLLRSDPERADAALRSIQDMGREALGEMRHMLGIERSRNGSGPPAPQPRLSDLAAMVERERDRGLAAHLSVEGVERPVAPGIELSAYRIVQEALTNARRHAAAGRVDVRVRYDPHQLVVEVADDGRGAAAAPDVTGHGLIGMRERVEFFGGEFRAGPRTEGGFAVSARFPIAAAP